MANQDNPTFVDPSSSQNPSQPVGDRVRTSPRPTTAVPTSAQGFVDPSSNQAPNQNMMDRVRTTVPPASAQASNAAATKQNETSPTPSMYEGGEEPENTKSGRGIFSKILIALLTLGIGGLGYYSYTLNEEKKRNEAELNDQKQQIVSQLEELKVSYDKTVEENKITNNDLVEARKKVVLYIDSLKTVKMTISEFAKYKNQVFTLRKERERLLAINDSLRKQNTIIRKQKDSISIALQSVTSYADSLANVTSKLKEVVQSGEELQISKLAVDGVKARSNGKMISTERAKASDKIRMCFTVLANKIAPAGTKNFYIQVTAPNGDVLGKNETATVDRKKIAYSNATKFIYANKNIDICDFVTPKGKSFEKGTYKITVFDDKLNVMGDSELLLK